MEYQTEERERKGSDRSRERDGYITLLMACAILLQILERAKKSVRRSVASTTDKRTRCADELVWGGHDASAWVVPSACACVWLLRVE